MSPGSRPRASARAQRERRALVGKDRSSARYHRGWKRGREAHRGSHQAVGPRARLRRGRDRRDTSLEEEEARLLDWLGRGWHGEMDYMARHGTRRARPAELVPGHAERDHARASTTRRPRRAIRGKCSRIRERAFVSRYALGRDYHKVLRAQAAGARRSHDRGARRLPLSRVHRQRAGDGSLARRARGPRLARQAHAAALARRGLALLPGRALREPRPREGRAGHRALRHVRALHRHLPHAGDRRALPARRAPLHLLPHHRAPRARSPRSCARSWATASTAATTASSCARGTSTRRRRRSPDFAVRNGLDAARLVELFAWTEEEFDRRFEGSAIRRIGHERWLRNIAVALGNAPGSSRPPLSSRGTRRASIGPGARARGLGLERVRGLSPES